MLPILAEFNELRENRSLDSRSYSCVMVHVGRDGRNVSPQLMKLSNVIRCYSCPIQELIMCD